MRDTAPHAPPHGDKPSIPPAGPNRFLASAAKKKLRRTGEFLAGHGAFFRVLIYGLTVTAYFALVARLAKKKGALTLFQENGMVELTQLTCILAASLLLALLAKKHSDLRGVLSLMALLAFFAGIRELNNSALYRRIFFFGAASWLLGGLTFIATLWASRRRLPREIGHLLRQPAALLLALGFVIIVGWAQVFAQESLLPVQAVDRIVEEGMECAGYLMVLFGVIELRLNLRPAPPRAGSPASKQALTFFASYRP